VGAVAFGTLGLSACETVSGVLNNETGSATEFILVDRSGQTLRGILAEGQGLVLRQPLDEIDYIEYGRGCRLSGAHLQAGPKPSWNEARSIALTVCGVATP
jgi:hypothetical protein